MEKLGGNGNGLVVKATSRIEFLQWISRRLITSGVSAKCTPYVISVELFFSIQEVMLMFKQLS